MVLTLISRKSLEAEEVVAHAVVRAGSSSPCPDELRSQMGLGGESYVQYSMERWSYKQDMRMLRVSKRCSKLPDPISPLDSAHV